MRRRRPARRLRNHLTQMPTLCPSPEHTGMMLAIGMLAFVCLLIYCWCVRKMREKERGECDPPRP